MTLVARHRVAAVSYFNSKPLIFGLADDPRIELQLAVPASLPGLLRDGSADVALLPVIDFQRLAGLTMLPRAGGIACDGPTLTVRIFSRVPFAHIRTLACDADSHTSVVLARVLLAELFGARPEQAIVDWTKTDATTVQADAALLIGDKVVCDEPTGFGYQLDLGQAWRELAGLPFVFAVWTARTEISLGDLPTRLAMAKRRGLSQVPMLVEQYAVPRGWPRDLANRYLTKYLKFDIGDRELAAIDRFNELAGLHFPSPAGRGLG